MPDALKFRRVNFVNKQRRIVEARILARCCFENAFLVAGLREQGRAFADRMKEDDDAGRKNRLKFARDSDAIFESLEPEMQQAVDTALSGLERSNLLKSAPFKELYLAYSQFSGDAAHPTLAALAIAPARQRDPRTRRAFGEVVRNFVIYRGRGGREVISGEFYRQSSIT
jgi:hypothetical protein